jgi:hypothetical protein
MARHFIPFNLKLKNIPVIVYPVKDGAPLQDIFESKFEIQRHLEDLYSQNSSIQKFDYHIVFVWNLEGNRMTDVWMHRMANWDNSSGPLVECMIFENLKESNDAGIASGDTLIVLAREEEFRRKIGDLEKYLKRSDVMPEFPKEFIPKEDFS